MAGKNDGRRVSKHWNYNPKVNIIIPNKDNIKVLDRAIKSIEKLTTYKNYKIFIVENNSTEEATFEYYKTLKEKFDNIEVLYYPEKGFNYSAIINHGVKNSTGDYIVQLNNDTELVTEKMENLYFNLIMI